MRPPGAGIPFAVPDASVLPERLDVVAQTAYLAFSAGYAPGTGPDLLRAEASGEAIRLVCVVLGLRRWHHDDRRRGRPTPVHGVAGGGR